jgi:hypothetical protein
MPITSGIPPDSVPLGRSPGPLENPLTEAAMHVLPVSLVEYVRGMAAAGRRFYPGSASACWVQYEPGTMIRLPIHSLQFPITGELSRLYWVRLAPLVSFLVDPDSQHPADSVLYICRDKRYSLQKLEHAARTNIRRGLREFRITFLTHAQLLRHGEQAFIDNHRKFDPAAATAEEFKRQYAGLTSGPGNVFIGAWKDDILAAFVHLVFVDDWVNISGRCAMEAFLNLRSNEVLLFAALFHFLVEKEVRIVTAGVASVDETANTPGLHRFKVKMGFKPVPVRRAFVLHPVLRPLAHQPARSLLSFSRKLFPQYRRLRLAESVLSRIGQHPA